MQCSPLFVSAISNRRCVQAIFKTAQQRGVGYHAASTAIMFEYANVLNIARGHRRLLIHLVRFLFFTTNWNVLIGLILFFVDELEFVEGVSYEEAYRACLLSFCEVLNDNKFSPYDIHTSGGVQSLLQSIDLVSTHCACSESLFILPKRSFYLKCNNLV